jgi:hypothetical protein
MVLTREHHTPQDRRVLLQAIVGILEPPVEPAEVNPGQVKGLAAGGRAELALREAAGAFPPFEP